MRSTLALFLTGAASLLTTSGHLAAQTDSPPTVTCENAPRWVEGANYKEGDIIKSTPGFLWKCKGGAATALCDDLGYEPDRYPRRAPQAWAYIGQCEVGDGAELQTLDVVVSSATCKGTLAVVTLTATITNNSGMRAEPLVAFYASENQTLIGVSEKLFFPEESFGETIKTSMTWRTPAIGTALITVSADDDGHGRSEGYEPNENDNILQVKLPTCPVPNPGPGPVNPQP